MSRKSENRRKTISTDSHSLRQLNQTADWRAASASAVSRMSPRAATAFDLDPLGRWIRRDRDRRLRFRLVASVIFWPSCVARQGR